MIAAVLASWACRRPDPQQVIDIAQLEAYWVIDTPVGNEQYIAPAVRLVLKNKGAAAAHALEATAVFKRDGQDDAWGSDWRRVAPGGKPLAAGQDTLLVLKSDARYHSPAAPEAMFQHENWKDVRVEVFLRLGSSRWTKFGELLVEKRIGARAVEAP